MCTVVVSTVGFRVGQRRYCKGKSCHGLSVAEATSNTPKGPIPCRTVPRYLFTEVVAAPRFDEIYLVLLVFSVLALNLSIRWCGTM